MLNIFFAFGVPIFLLIIYLIIELIRKNSDVHYLGLVLFIIAGFLSAFSLQVIQQALTELNSESIKTLTAHYGYSPYWLAVPLLTGVILIIINLFRAYHRLKKSKHNRT
ncbi:MAG TPA: hypothetical protein VK118_03165 [Tetragenococcus sp.]|nr:hypothetical protein [Tetragenococcus sp.]